MIVTDNNMIIGPLDSPPDVLAPKGDVVASVDPYGQVVRGDDGRLPGVDGIRRDVPTGCGPVGVDLSRGERVWKGAERGATCVSDAIEVSLGECFKRLTRKGRSAFQRVQQA